MEKCAKDNSKIEIAASFFIMGCISFHYKYNPFPVIPIIFVT